MTEIFGREEYDDVQSLQNKDVRSFLKPRRDDITIYVGKITRSQTSKQKESISYEQKILDQIYYTT